MSRRHAVALSSALLTFTCLAACTSSDPTGTPTTSSTPTGTTPSATSTPSPTTTTTATATATDPTSTATSTIPPAATKHTKAGAEAFVRFYFGELNKAWMEPSVRNLAAYGAPGCKSCAANLDVAAYLVSKQQRYLDPPASASSFSVRDFRDGETIDVLLDLKQERARIGDMKGNTVEVVPAQGKLATVVTVRHADKTWLISTIKAG